MKGVFQNGTATDFSKKQKALDKVKRANAELAKVVREEKEQLRKTQDCHKYMMGGCVVKYWSCAVLRKRIGMDR